MADKQLKDKAVSIKGKKYVLVSDRVLYFNETYPNGAIDTDYTLDGDTYHFKATITPDVESSRRFVGHSQATIGDGMVNKTAAMENAETSAVGRALAMMGIGVIESIASVDEINKATGSTGEPRKATDKQIKTIYDAVARLTGYEQADDIENWLEKATGVRTPQLITKSAGAIITKLFQAEKDKKGDVKEDIVIDPDTVPANVTLDNLPY